MPTGTITSPTFVAHLICPHATKEAPMNSWAAENRSRLGKTWVQQPPSPQERGVQATHALQVLGCRAIKNNGSTQTIGDLKLLIQPMHPHCSSAPSSSSSPPASPAVPM